MPRPKQALVNRTSHVKAGLSVNFDRETFDRLTAAGNKKLWVKVDPKATRGFIQIGAAPFQDASPLTPFKSQAHREYPDRLIVPATANFPQVRGLPSWPTEPAKFEWEGSMLLIEAPATQRVRKRLTKALATTAPRPEGPGPEVEPGPDNMTVAQAVRVINEAKRQAGSGMMMLITRDGELLVNFAL